MDNASFIASQGPKQELQTADGILLWNSSERMTKGLFMRARLDPMLREEVLMTAPEATEQCCNSKAPASQKLAHPGHDRKFCKLCLPSWWQRPSDAQCRQRCLQVRLFAVHAVPLCAVVMCGGVEAQLSRDRAFMRIASRREA